jgi:hypothetical protein
VEYQVQDVIPADLLAPQRVVDPKGYPKHGSAHARTLVDLGIFSECRAEVPDVRVVDDREGIVENEGA